MNRRQFIQNSAAALAAGSFVFNCSKDEMDRDIVTRLVQHNDARIPDLLMKQHVNEQHEWYGGLIDEYGIHSSGLTSGFIRHLTCAMLSPQSKYYHSADIVGRLETAAKFLVHRQHDDGTIDLHTTNFHSTPDTGFVLEWICGAYGLLAQEVDVGLHPLKEDLKAFILKAAHALTVGGIHTPNHRWVVCMALARANSLFPNEKYVERINEWLGEHIDIDPDGQYTEKSASIYSPLTNRCLITVARLLNRHELYEPVRKNLDMTLYYIHPNGEVVTEASKRQDQYQYGDMAPYYYPYRYMALLDGDNHFSAMTTWIEQKPERLVQNLMYFMEENYLKQTVPAAAPLPTHYDILFSHSNLARIRREKISATILADNFTLFSFRKNETVLQSVRFASAFFGKGQFKGEKLEHVDGIYQMSQKLDGPYYQPFPKNEIPADGDWEKMDKEKRPKSEIQELESVVHITQQNGTFHLHINIHGTNGVPVAVEVAFRHGGQLTGVKKVDSIANAYFLKEGMGRYVYKDQAIEFGPGLNQHKWTQLRGAEPKLDALSVYLTGFTPLKWTLEIS